MASNLPINLVVEFNDLDNVQNYNERFFLARNGVFKQTLNISQPQGFVNVDISNLAPGVEKVLIIPVDKFYPQSKVTVRFNVDTGSTTYDLDLPTKKLLLWTIHQDFISSLTGLQIATESITPMNVYVYFISTAVDPDTQQNFESSGTGIVTSVNGRDGDIFLTSADVGLDKVNNTADTAKPVSVAQQQALNTKQSIAEKGIANGYASLDGTGKVPSSQIPASAGSVWGTISGTLSSQTDLQTALDNKRNFTQNILYVQKTPGPHEFGSIAAAANSIVGATSNNRYVIDIGPGIFTEPAIVLPDWVSIRGSEIQATVIQPNSAHHVVAPGTNSEISFVTIQGATSGYAGIACLDKGNYTQVHKVSIYDCDIGILATASSQDSYTYLEYVDMDYDYTNALKIVSSGGFSAFVNAENLYTFPDPGYTGNDILLQGSGSSLSLLTFGLLGQPGATGIRIQGGGLLSAQAGYFLNYATAISTDNVGSPTLNLNGPDFRQCTTNLNLPSASTSGYLVGYSAHTKNVINGASNFFIADKNTQIVTVSRTGGDYTSVAAAVASITDASIMKQYVVSVGPGIFVEPQIVMKSYVYLVGCGNQITVLSAASPNGHFIVGADNSAVDAVYITGATSGVGVYYEGSGTGIFELIHSQFGSNLTHCQVYGNTQTTIILIDSCGMGADNFTNGIIVSGNSGIVTEAVIVDIVADKLVPPYMSGDFISVSGNRTDVRISNLQVDNADPLLGSPSGNGIVVSNGANLLVNATLMSGFAKGIWVQNSGSAPTVRAFAVSLLDNIQDLRVDHASATGSFDGLADANKVYINPSATYPYNFQDTTSGNLTISGQLKLGFSDNSHEDVSTLLINSTPMGLISGGALSAGGGFTVNVTSGFGYVDLSSILKKITWSNTSIVLTANTTNYIYFNSSGVLSANSAKPSTLTSVLLGRVVTNSTGIELLEKSSMSSYHVDNTYDTSFRKAFGPIYASGSAVSENATPFHLNVTGGNYFYSTTEFIPTGGNAISFQQYSQNGSGGWNISTTQTVDHSRYDDGSGTLPALTAGYFARHALYLVGDGANEKYFLVFSQSQYATQLLAETGTLPFPPSWISDGVALIASIIVQQGASNIIEIRDERPRLGFKSSGTSSSTDHEALSNRDSLTAHTQYLLKNGTDTMGGTLNMGSNPITNVTLINSIDIATHASRHNPGGPDALATGVPVNIADANAAGTGTAYARNDHIHGHGSQTNPTHHAIATSIAHGFMSSVDKTKLDSVSTLELSYLSGVTSAIQGQINGIKATTVNGHPLSANVNVALSELSDVTLTAPALGNLLSYNGAHWVNSPASSAVSAGPGVNYFLTTTPSGVLTYDVISKTPDTASEVDESYTANNNTVSMGGYITSSPPGGTQLDAGIWTFNMYLYCSSPAGTNTVTANVYSRTSGGIETLLFSAPSDNIINSNVSLHSINSVQPAYSIGATDNVVIKFTFTTTNTFNTTIHLIHSGSAHYSYINTPLILRHNDLEALQGGNSTERFHLSNAEYVGSGTGVFLRQSLPFISAPVIQDSSDNTKRFAWSFAGQSTGTTATLTSLLTQNTALTVRPTVDATANIVLQNATSGQVFIGADSTIGGSNAGIQYSDATTANRAQIKLHSYVNATSVAGVATLTSRSGAVGSNSAVSAGQDYSKWTAQACASTPGSAPISGTFAFKANTINSLTVTSDFHIQLTNLAGVLADRFYLGSEGQLQLPGYSTGVAHFDASGNITSTSVSLTADVAGVLSVANGGTNSPAALNNSRIMISSGGAIVEQSAITGNRAIVSNGSGLPVASATTDTQIGYLSNTTSDVQAQINTKISAAATMTFASLRV